MAVNLDTASVRQNFTEQEIYSITTIAIVATIRQIAADNIDRMANFKTDITKLNKGVLYANEYYGAMKEIKTLDCYKTSEKIKSLIDSRLNFFIEKGSFFHGYASPKHFSRMKVSTDQVVTGTRINHYKMLSGKTPSECLNEMIGGLSLLGCTETLDLVYYKAIEILVGKEKFEQIFASDAPLPFMIGENDFDNPMAILIKQVNTPNSISDVKAGEVLYIASVSQYNEKHCNGESRGYNVFCTSTNPHLFVGLGLPPEGYSYDQICQKLLEEYNKTPIDINFVTPEVASRLNKQQIIRSESLSKHQMTLDEFIKLGGGRIIARMGLDIELIAKIGNLALRDIKEAQKSIKDTRDKRVEIEKQKCLDRMASGIATEQDLRQLVGFITVKK